MYKLPAVHVLETEITQGLLKPFAVVRKKGKDFTATMHAHPELELVYIKHGAGQRLIGDHLAPFEEGEMILLGSKLPHRWVPAAASRGSLESLVMYLHPDVFSPAFYKDTSCGALQQLLHDAGHGIRITGSKRAHIASKLEKLSRKSGLPVMSGILDILNELTDNIDTEPLHMSSQDIPHDHLPVADRLQPVYQYVAQNFPKDISLGSVAALACLSEAAFCRLFRQRTHTHFVAYLNEIRLQHACKLLTESDEAVSHIAHQCGFKTVSNFNKCFRRVRNMSPMQYRQQMQRICS